MLFKPVYICMYIIFFIITGTFTAAVEPLQDPSPIEEFKRENALGQDANTDLVPAAVERQRRIKPVSPANSLFRKEHVVQLSELTEDREKWETPMYLQKAFPYYHSGFDDEGRPVWILEGGKFPAKYIKLLDQVEEEKLQSDIDNYIIQAACRIVKSIHGQNSSQGGVEDAFVVIDAEGLGVSDIAHPKLLAIIVKSFRDYRELLSDYLGGALVVNVNYIAEALASLLRPILGRVMEKVEIYGTNTNKWKAVFRKKLPMKSIPTWYGGSSDFKPIQVYG